MALRATSRSDCRAAAWIAIWLLSGAAADLSAQDGGPDFYRVSGVSPGSSLNFRSGPNVDAPVIARIPPETDGLRNLGCVGAMSFAEFQSATPGERAAARRRRWCRLEYQGIEGWAAGWYLAEGGPPPAGSESRDIDTELQPGGQVSFQDRIVGRGIVNYAVDAVAGQTLRVSFRRHNRFLYFNVTAALADAAIFAGAGSLNPDEWSGVLRDTGTYIVTVFLMRNAARRDEVGPFEIDLNLDAASVPRLEGYVPANTTDFDATAVTRCSVDSRAYDRECGLGVFRGQTTQTVYVQRPGVAGPPFERVLVFRGSEVFTEPASPVLTEHIDDSWHLEIDGREHFVVPDVVLTGD